MEGLLQTGSLSLDQGLCCHVLGKRASCCQLISSSRRAVVQFPTASTFFCKSSSVLMLLLTQSGTLGGTCLTCVACSESQHLHRFKVPYQVEDSQLTFLLLPGDMPRLNLMPWFFKAEPVFDFQLLDGPSAQAFRERHSNIHAKMLNNRIVHVESLVQILLLFAQRC